MVTLANTINRYKYELSKSDSISISATAQYTINWSDIADLTIADFGTGNYKGQIQATWQSNTAGVTGYLNLYDQFGGANVTGSGISQVFTNANQDYTTLGSEFSFLTGAKDYMFSGYVSSASTLTVSNIKLYVKRNNYGSISGLANTRNDLILNVRRFPINQFVGGSSSFELTGSLSISPKYYYSAFSRGKVSFSIGNCTASTTNQIYWELRDQSANVLSSGNYNLPAPGAALGSGWVIQETGWVNLSGVTSLNLYTRSSDTRTLAVSVATLVVKEI